MKKILSLSLISALCLAAGCASTGSSAPSAANTPMTLDEALQKSAETRQKLIDAKKAYEDAKSAADASQANNTSISSELAKQAVQNKVDATKQKIEAEKAAWKDALGN